MTELHIGLLLAAMLAGFTGFTVLLVGFRIVHTENWHFRSAWGLRVSAANSLAFGFAALLLLFLIVVAVFKGMNPNDASFVLCGFAAGLAIALLVRWLAATQVVRVSSRAIIDAFPEDLPSDGQGPSE